jgi:hypothetical protein
LFSFIKKIKMDWFGFGLCASSAPPTAACQVILATNIAESSITIDDAVYVVDSGKVKERRFAFRSGVSSLTTQWCAGSNARQRLGRAGRVRHGLCVRLFTRPRSALLAAFGVPEMRRLPLDELCLAVGHGPATPGQRKGQAVAPLLSSPRSFVHKTPSLGCCGLLIRRFGVHRLVLAPR